MMGSSLSLKFCLSIVSKVGLKASCFFHVEMQNYHWRGRLWQLLVQPKPMLKPCSKKWKKCQMTVTSNVQVSRLGKPLAWERKVSVQVVCTSTSGGTSLVVRSQSLLTWRMKLVFFWMTTSRLLSSPKLFVNSDVRCPVFYISNL